MARKRKTGPRGKTGRLQGWKARDYGNDIAQARRALFDCMAVRDGKAPDEVQDGIGRLWALDLLDGHSIDPAVLRDTGRRYAQLYWRRNADKAPRVGEAERVGYSKPSLTDTTSDLLLERWLDDLPIYERQVLEMVVVDHWHSDSEAPFVERLVGLELMERGRIMFAEPLHPGDRNLLEALLRALFVLVDGVVPSRRAA